MQRKSDPCDCAVLPKNITPDLKLNVNDVLYALTVNCNASQITIEWIIELLRTQDTDISIKLIRVGDLLTNVNNQPEALLAIAVNDLNEKTTKMLQSKKLAHSEQQKCVLLFLESLHIKEKGVLFGYPQVKLYPGQSILYVCQREGVIGQYFPMHNEQDLNFLKQNWCLSFKSQPIHEIRAYFGESIAFYFTFLEYYTKALIGPSIASLSYFFFGYFASPFCALFNVIWIALFLKYWKRRSNELAHEWGTLSLQKPESARPAFRGKSMGVDPVTEKPVPVYPIHKTWIKEYLVSLPLVFVCLFLAFKVMIFYFAVEAVIVQYCDQNPSFMNGAFVHLPGVAYALVVIAMSHFYRIFADKLNNWENHRTQSSHEGHLIIKLVMFEFVNNFMSIFYVAFYVQDMSMLKWQIGTLLVVNQIVDNLQEVFLPLWASRKSNVEISLVKKKDLTEDQLKIIRESKLPVYENTYFDYLELYIQFGHVFLFASVFPFAPILALINNLIEIRSDSFKLCYAFQRPHQRSADGINGGWMKTFEVMALIAVVTNCSLVLMTPFTSFVKEYFNPSDFQLLLATVAIEHILFALILVINYVIPDLPKRVRIAIAKQSR